MKFKATSYHQNLMKDDNRLAVFLEAINRYVSKNNSHNLTAFDVGAGCGVLSFFLQPYFKKIFSIEIDSNAYKCASLNLACFNNIEVINDNAIDFDFPTKTDLIVCEMLDTALIDEEQVPALKNAKRYLNDGGVIIPQKITNIAELVCMEREYLHYEDIDLNIKYQTMSDSLIYSEFDFLDEICPYFETELMFNINIDGVINGIKLTSITTLFEDIVCGPTPMLNPPLLIPLESINVKHNDLINVKLKYIMGEGIETIESYYIR